MHSIIYQNPCFSQRTVAEECNAGDNENMERYSERYFLGGLLFVGALILFVGDVSFAYADAPLASGPKAPSYVRIFYYREGKHAHTSLLQHASSIDILAPQAYSLNAAGVLQGSIKPDVLQFAKNNNIQVLPLVTNKKFSPSVAKEIFENPSKRDIALLMLVAEAKKKKFLGWQFDFEGMDASYRDQYSIFIQQASKILKENNLTMSVAVMAQTSANPDDYPKNLWQRVVGAYDYATLSRSADFVSVMSYDDPSSKGPSAGYPWVKKVIEYSLQFIPKEKLSLGIPLYYWQWDEARQKLVGIGGYEGIKNVLSRYRVTQSYDDETESPFLSYTRRNKQYTIWYENAESVGKRIDLISEYHLYGFSAWALGLEMPDIHQLLVYSSDK